MALSITTLRNLIQTSIYGRRLGLDPAGRLIGNTGNRIPVTDNTSGTTATNITGFGFHTVDTTTNDGWYLSAPVPGEFLHIYTGPSTSTGIRTITRADATFAIQTSASSTITTIVAQAGNLMLELFGVTSTAYAIMRQPGSTEMALNGTT